jgi:hypothetical protein
MGFGADNTKPGATPAAKATLDFKLTQIQVVPAQVVFSNPREYRRVLVLGKTEGAGEIDLTREASFTPADDCVKADEKGFVYPV